jgi:hypothetical protein
MSRRSKTPGKGGSDGDKHRDRWRDAEAPRETTELEAQMANLEKMLTLGLGSLEPEMLKVT